MVPWNIVFHHDDYKLVLCLRNIWINKILNVNQNKYFNNIIEFFFDINNIIEIEQ